MKIPAHKVTDPNKLPGQITSSPSAADVVLDDYIKRKQAAYGMEPKLTFEEWYQRRLVDFDGHHPPASVVWKAAQENK